MSAREDVRQAAHEAQARTGVRAAARGGYAASGVVHALIGVVVLVVAFGGDAETDQAGAFKAIAAAPAGFAVLWVIASLLWALAGWHVLDGITAPRVSGARKWGRRVSEWGQALVFAVLGVIAAAVALGARPSGDEAAQGASRGILAIPGGPFLLGAIGLGVGIAGVVFVWMGVARSFRSKVAISAGPLGHTVTVLGVVGFVAKGVALAIIGALLMIAAVQADAAAAGGLDAAIQLLLGMLLGPLLVGVVGAGFIAYGVFCCFRARFARL